MFNCESCQRPTGPRVSPILVVTETRERVYLGIGRDEEDRVLVPVGTGYEIVKERKICPACAGVVVPTVREDGAEARVAKGVYLSALAHVKKCKEKLIEDCTICQRIVRVLSTIPAPIISTLTENPRAREFTTSLGAVLVDNLIKRADHKGKRAQRDYAAAYSVLKPYEQRGGGI